MEPTHKPTEVDALPFPAARRGPARGPLGATPEDEHAEFVALRLVLQPGGLTIEVNWPEVLVGRHSEADIRLPLPDVSRRHCRLEFAQGCWRVVDLDSLNGVFVNGERVRQEFLAEGDLLQVGGFTFAAELAPPASGGPVQNILKMLLHPAHVMPPRRKAG